MTGAIANLLVNVLIIALLVVTIGYCWVLNRRIKILQDSKGELALLLKHFDESTQRASESIIALQTASKKIGETIQVRTEKAHFILDDLGFMIEKAEKTLNQVEAGVAVGRAKSRMITEDEPAPVKAAVMAAPREAQEKPDKQTPSQRAAGSRESTLAALQAVIERAKRRSPSDSMDEEEPISMPPPKPRSKSEQELLEMIRAGFKG